MVLKLYMTDASPPVRTTLIVAKALNIELELVNLDLTKGEHLKPEYLQINPQHTIPTLVDDGRAIWDSHAINLYLIEKYAKGTPLYPNDIYKKAAINQRLFFDAEHLFPSIKNIVAPMFLQKRKDISEEGKAKVEEVYTFLETFLESGKYMVGNEVTLADITFIPAVTSLNEIIPINAKFVKLHDWIVRVKTLPWYSENVEGLANFKKLLHAIMGKA